MSHLRRRRPARRSTDRRGRGEGPSGQPPRHSSNPPPGRPTFPAIPGYAILGVLGRGRAGVVYEALELARDRRVTLEVIESERNGASGDIGLVHLDAGATRLHHPNIVPVLSCGRHDGAEFLVSEYVKGENLREHLEGGSLPALTAAEVVETLARAVHEAHRLGFRHGDLTAARVLLTPSHPPRFVDPDLGHLCEENGRELIPRITGFGMAGARERGGTRTRRSRRTSSGSGRSCSSCSPASRRGRRSRSIGEPHRRARGIRRCPRISRRSACPASIPTPPAASPTPGCWPTHSVSSSTRSSPCSSAADVPRRSNPRSRSRLGRRSSAAPIAGRNRSWNP